MSRQLSLFKYINSSTKSSTSSSAKHDTNEESGNDNCSKRRRCEDESETDHSIDEEGDKNG